MSSPIVVTCSMDGPLCWSFTVQLGTSMPFGGHPPHQARGTDGNSGGSRSGAMISRGLRRRAVRIPADFFRARLPSLGDRGGAMAKRYVGDRTSPPRGRAADRGEDGAAARWLPARGSVPRDVAVAIGVLRANLHRSIST